jgi:hypothetical protein
MPRQPFLPTYHKAKFRFLANPLRDRPDISRRIGECIGLWTQVEVQMALLLSTLMKADTGAAVAVFLSIRNARAQREAVSAAAENALTGDKLEAYSAIANVYKSLEGQRNDLAHGVFGISDEIPDAILWMEPKEHTGSFVKWLAKLATSNETPDLEIEEGIFVYKLNDIETLISQIQELWTAILMFWSHLRWDISSLSASQFQQLCELPQIQQEISRLRLAQKNTPEAHPLQPAPKPAE